MKIILYYPHLRGNLIALILGYARPNNSLHDHIPAKFRDTLRNLEAKSPVPTDSGGTDLRDQRNKDLFIDSDDETKSRQKNLS